MPRLAPAVGSRRPDPDAALERYRLLVARQDRSRLVAFEIAGRPADRPRWLAPAIDYVAVPLLLATFILAAAAYPWLLAAAALHLASVYVTLRRGARPGAR